MDAAGGIDSPRMSGSQSQPPAKPAPEKRGTASCKKDLLAKGNCTSSLLRSFSDFIAEEKLGLVENKVKLSTRAPSARTRIRRSIHRRSEGEVERDKLRIFFSDWL
ncbi:hypothetical protein SASPL_125698 [Salvia splendens]|uniref:Uncharacterized protein n=1 Tax=Salvia splendens TaxID=180675 RepID=A0A8X8XHL3_SALSN|nr:uncharacterized protein LOC121748360 [Salvia splendens]KAG6413002.1 hypothetical protein SASPL_125698 [Salvia splendens]